MAIEAGYRAPFYVEHYGGDGLSVSATNREYLRRILPRAKDQHECAEWGDLEVWTRDGIAQSELGLGESARRHSTLQISALCDGNNH